MKRKDTLYWKKSKLYILNQLLLPAKIKYIPCRKYKDVSKAIRDMSIRGAPAIGVAALLEWRLHAGK